VAAVSPMGERLRFVARLLDGEKMASFSVNSATRRSRPSVKSLMRNWKGSCLTPQTENLAAAYGLSAAVRLSAAQIGRVSDRGRMLERG
jgi:hypothetical protein